MKYSELTYLAEKLDLNLYLLFLITIPDSHILPPMGMTQGSLENTDVWLPCADILINTGCDLSTRCSKVLGIDSNVRRGTGATIPHLSAVGVLS